MTTQEFLTKNSIEFIAQPDDKEVRITCPFCTNTNKKCYIHTSSGVFYCFHCGVGGRFSQLAEKLRINLKDEPLDLTEYKLYEEEYPLTPIDPEIIKENHERLTTGVGSGLVPYLHTERGLTDETIKKFLLGWDGRNITIPIIDASGECVNFKLRPDPTRPGNHIKVFNIPGRGRKQLFNAKVLRKKQERVIICFSPDTEVLTENGWQLIASLKTEKVAQYHSNSGQISYTVPREKQVFDFNGELFNFSADFSDVLVTPEHRMLVKRQGCKQRILQAKDIGGNISLPVSGIYEGNKMPFTQNQIKLMVAYCIDGHKEARSYKRRWNLKKQRKIKRLKTLLNTLNIPFNEKHYPSALSWTVIQIDSRDAPFLEKISPNKKIPPNSPFWSFKQRKTLLDELRYWDGDGRVSSRVFRFFTSQKDQANLICAIAATTGYGAIMREDKRKKRFNYIVNIKETLWRQMSKVPRKITYKGKVYCLTTNTGFVITRRNGKVTITGQCEGEYDCMLLSQMGYAAVTSTGGVNSFDTTWIADFSTCEKIYICFDNDLNNAGQDAAVKLAQRFYETAGVKVWIINLPGLVMGEKKLDISDFILKRKKEKTDITNLLKSASQYLATLDKGQYDFLEWKELEQMEFPTDQWIVDHLIPEESICCIAGLPGTMKSYFVNYLASSILQGKPILEKFKTKKVPILFIDKENRLSRIQDRLKRLGTPITDDMEKMYFQRGDFLFEKADAVTVVENFIVKHNIKLVVLDTLVRMHERQENDASEMNRIFQVLHRFVVAGASVLFIHHFRKPSIGYASSEGDIREMLRGSGDILAQLDIYFALKVIEGTFLQLEMGKSRDEKLIKPFLIEAIFEETSTYFNFLKEIEPDDRVQTIAHEDVVYSLIKSGNYTRSQLLTLTEGKISRGTFDRVLKRLKEEGRITTFTNGNKEYIYIINKDIETGD